MPRTQRRGARKNARGVRPVETPAAATISGVYTSRVVSLRDPDGIGRVKVKLPRSISPGPVQRQVWARLATLVAGHKRGTWFVPEVGDEVLIAFDEGDAARPVVLGALWNAQADPPAAMDGRGENNQKLIRLRSGVQIAFSDAEGEEELVLETPAGQKIAIEDGPARVTITDTMGNAIVLEPLGIRVTAAAKIQIEASNVSLSAGMLTVDAGMSKFSGVVHCDTLISNSVVSASYTPGAGNIW